ncbi:MAG: biotin/lipoyl-containing protein [Acidimicrobiales bacterium]
MQIPDDLRYSSDHEWAVDLPKVGTAVSAGGAIGEVESTKSVSEIYAPVSGTVTAVNELLVSATETVNTDPYGEGWICEITTSDSSDFDELLDPASYGALTNN